MGEFIVMNLEIRLFNTQSEWIESVTREVAARMEETATKGKRDFHLCLAGGSTPKPVYEALASDARIAPLASALQVHIWPGDERVVPANSPQRNGAMITAAFARASSTWANPPLFHLWPEQQDPAAACAAFSLELESMLSDSPVFDLSLLGMGDDGHTAGLFTIADATGQDRFDYAGCLRHAGFAFPTIAPSEPQSRMTLSGQVLRDSAAQMILTRGPAKLRLLEDIAAGRRQLSLSFALRPGAVACHCRPI
ncbi:MAG: 6-phosphogluconolactonase [Spirochaetaceae bacterium]|nr:6-phosphogluconolactonase [Spirochaetaceae bacterium]